MSKKIVRGKFRQYDDDAVIKRRRSDHARDGDRLTSMTHGRSESSMRMSKPNSSAQQITAN